jgi:hypothetical protein
MHQAINDIVCLVFSGANDEGMIEEVAHVDEGIGTDPSVMAKVFEGVARME